MLVPFSIVADYVINPLSSFFVHLKFPQNKKKVYSIRQLQAYFETSLCKSHNHPFNSGNHHFCGSL